MPPTPRNTTMRDRARARLRRAGAPCWICGEPIDYTLVRPDPMSFVLEHVKPVDKFPELAHDPNNQRSAHYVCNARKGNREHANIIRRSGALK